MILVMPKPQQIKASTCNLGLNYSYLLDGKPAEQAGSTQHLPLSRQLLCTWRAIGSCGTPVNVS